MLSKAAARKIGINACIDRIGRSFVVAHKATSSSACGMEPWENKLFCFVGVDDNPPANHSQSLVLDNSSKFPYFASCNVSLINGEVEYLECVSNN